MFTRFRLPAFTSLLALLLITTAQAQTGAFSPTTQPVSPAGVRAVVDLPASQHMRNTGGSDGLGLCVFTSLEHAARWQNLIGLNGYRAWMERRPGGGYPQKVDSTLAAYCREKGVPVPAYIQHTGGDDEFLDLAIHTGRCPGVTYAGSDDFYRGGIDHMVNLAHIDDTRAAIIDNNRPGNWVWMTRAEFLSRWRARGGGWAVVFLDPPPPPYNSIPTSADNCGCEGNTPCTSCGPDCQCPRPPIVYGQCANGRCVRPSTTPIGQPPSNRHYWGQFPNGQSGWLLKDDTAAAANDTLPTGVVRERIHDHPAYSVSGRTSTKDEVHSLLKQGALSDDTDRWHIAAIGDADFLTKFRTDIAALPAEVRGKLLVQTYTPTAWPVAQFHLPVGVVLRKPVVGRISADVGSIAAAEYSTARLTTLLGEPTGPTPRPAPPPAPPSPPAPNQPAPPNSDPPPATPTPITIPWQLIAIVLGGYLLLFRRK